VPGALLLDLDRTIVDVGSFVDYDSAWAEVVAIVGDPAAPADLGLETFWTPATRACAALLAALPPGETWDRVDRVVASYELAGAARSIPTPGAPQFLEVVADRPTAVVTRLSAEAAALALDRNGMHVDVVVARDPQVRPKPSGDGVRRALAMLGAPATDAVMVGDSTWDAAAAADAGVRFIGVHAPKKEFRALFPDVRVCDSLADVLRRLRRIG